MSKTINNTRGRTEYLKAIIAEKSRNFVGREFVFSAINKFINENDKGYLTIIGEPGSGKSAIAAQYFNNNNNVVYYNFSPTLQKGEDWEDSLQQGENNKIGDYEIFLEIVNYQLLEILSNLGTNELDNELENDRDLFSFLLQKISDKLTKNQPLTIIIDGFHKLDLNKYQKGANLLYLPRYLPKNIYFILTRYPFPNNKSNLLVETPSRILDLSNYSEENQKDIQTYLQTYDNHQEISKILDKNDTNFMYISEIIKHPNLSPETLPEKLENYYQQHWNIINKTIKKDLDLSLQILQCLLQQNSLISLKTIADILDEDEYDIEIILEQWREFLHLETQDNIEYYRFYHPTFHHWLKQKIGVMS
ncbi:MAG: AAA family ATPase [Crocosphaera sp.]|nr:AAA family ATPase [Crocosphaera sp.]